MKKITLIFGIALVLGLSFSSCRSQKKACAAYSQVELPDGNQVES